MSKTIQAKIDALTPDLRNTNKHTERGVGMLEKSLRKYGAGRSILVDKTGRVIAGNATLQGAADIGLDDVLIVQTDGTQLVAVQRTDLDLDSKEARELAIADNRTSEVGLDWDTTELEALIADGVELGDFWGADELAELLADAGGDAEPGDAPEPQIDRAAELQEKWQTARGQIWGIGKHRLMCGDCTVAEDVAALFAGNLARLTWTDPPYGVSYGAKLKAGNPMGYKVRDIENDDLPPEQLEQFIRSAMLLSAMHSLPGAAIYVACPAGTLLPALIAAFAGSSYEYRWQLIWLKDQIVLSRADYHFKHENILYGWKPDGAHYFTPDRTQASVFEFDRPKSSPEHPTMEPVPLIAQMIKNSSQRDDIVYDAFIGSGSTMCAAQQLDRICYGMEIEPKYVAVTLERMGDMGLKPELLQPDGV